MRTAKTVQISAAVKVTGRPTNGWDFWQCKMPGKAEFVRINKLGAGSPSQTTRGHFQSRRS